MCDVVCGIDGMWRDNCDVCITEDQKESNHATFNKHNNSVAVGDKVIGIYNNHPDMYGELIAIDFKQRHPFKVKFEDGDWKNFTDVIKIEEVIK